MSDDFHKRSGYLDKGEILSLVTEEEIFSLVFGYEPKEYDRVCSPLRKDGEPNCYFEVNPVTGRLEMIDWATSEIRWDSFNTVKTYYNLPNFYLTLFFIHKHLIEGKNKEVLEKKVHIAKTKEKTNLAFKARYFIECDKTFWSKFKISRANLIEDKVFPVSKYSIIKEGKNVSHNIFTPTYAYTEFSSGNRKLYFPYKKKPRFVTNCTADDVGGVHNIDPFAQYIIITKSYKDYRVIKNQGFNVVWFQNEGMVPSKEVLINILKLGKYEEIYLFFDNDSAGIEALNKVKEKLESYYFITAIIYKVHLPINLGALGIKDPANLVEYKSELELKKFLNGIIINT